MAQLFVQQDPQLEARKALASALLARGLQGNRQVRTPLQGIGNLASIIAGSYMQNKAADQEKQRQQTVGDTLAKAISASRTGLPAWQNPDNPSQTLVPAKTGADALTAVLAGNPDTAPMAAQIGIQQAMRTPSATFTPVRDEKGNIIGQRNSTTNQVVSYPGTGGSTNKDIMEQANAIFPNAPDKARVWAQMHGVPSSVAEDYYRQSLPENRRSEFTSLGETAKTVKVNGVENIMVRNADGTVSLVPTSTVSKEAKSQAEIAGSTQGAKSEAQNKAKFKAAFPKVRDSLTQADQQWDNLTNDQGSGVLDKTIAQVEASPNMMAGAMGKLLSGVWNTPQFNLAENLKTIKANIGFDRLQQMRNSSPTGGALGQVTEMENKLLQATVASMEQGQSGSQLVDNLKRVRDNIRATKARTHNAFEADYGDFMGAQGAQSNAPDVSAMSDQDLLKALGQ